MLPHFLCVSLRRNRVGRVGERESAFERKREREREREGERERQTQRGRLVPDTETRKSRGGRVREKKRQAEKEGENRGITRRDTKKALGRKTREFRTSSL